MKKVNLEKKSDRYALYQGAKYEVENFFEDHGYSLPELYKIAQTNNFWRAVCKSNYEKIVRGEKI